jgi:hypothetical protein
LSYKDKPLPDENLREKIASETLGVPHMASPSRPNSSINMMDVNG